MARNSNPEQEDVVDGNYNPLPEIKQFCMEALKTPRDIGFWSTTIHTTWAYMKNSREWVEYEEQAKTIREDIARRREEYIREHVAAYENATAINREAVWWDFNALFHYYGTNPILRSILPPLPWNHTEVEAREVQRRLTIVTFIKAAIPCEAKLLKLFFVTKGYTDM
jgi:hypothetical protein